LHNSGSLWDNRGGVAVRASICLVAVAFALTGLTGAASAQSYPPQPPPPADYYPPPPEPYDGPPPGYDGQATVPPGTVYADEPPVYGARPAYPGYGPPPAYPGYGPPPSQPYFVRDGAPPPAAAIGSDGVPRPPSDVYGVPPDATGTVRPPVEPGPMYAALPPEDRPEQGPAKELPPQFRRQLVDYNTSEPAGTIIIDTPHTYLYLMLGRGKALRYGIGVGREGFTWTGTERISRMSEWPDWHPPKEMIERQPYLPRFMAGGDGNPLGARAMYLGNTLYRIHGTNQPSTIGSFVSSGCIRLTNEDVADLYSRVNVGTRVIVLPGSPPDAAALQQSRATR
jgi:lipoprotein-anchoring transpeptidase ErfK/SrfK